MVRDVSRLRWRVTLRLAGDGKAEPTYSVAGNHSTMQAALSQIELAISTCPDPWGFSASIEAVEES